LRAHIAEVTAAVLITASLLLVVVGTSAAPLSRTCAPSLPEGACTAAVSAVVRRGLTAFHPLILAARVEPGSEPRPEQVGHRATVRFDLLGVPRPLRIELHYDQGAHWGGVPDRGEPELAAYALAPMAVAGLIGVAIVGLSRRRRRDPASATD